MRVLVAAMLVWAGLGNAVRAQATEEEAREACTDDAIRFCATSIPNREKVGQCLRANRAQISADCRIVLDGGKPPKKG